MNTSVKKVLLAMAVIVALLVVLEMVNLLRLKSSLNSYATYWKQQPTSGTFTYVALGDSAAQGIGASAPQKGYVGLLADQIAQKTGQKVRIVNLSVSGATVDDVIAKQLPELKNYKPDLITVEIGGNDIVRNPVAEFATSYNKLARALPAGTLVSNIPYFGGRIKRPTQTVEASAVVAKAAQQNHLKLVDLYTETKQTQSLRNYAADFFHPNNRGYKNWDAAFWKVVEPLLK